ncbi:MAG: hypothetical protein GW858_12880 [Sphingomonadales bacterium]|nr:hypothetical protein [Sphingomonadales bacterium]NCQ21922.1 hypothetical protein [Sphingomonadales bacterium]NCT04556.1 hypothetical protein [Sphingomonadales bacterium]
MTAILTISPAKTFARSARLLLVGASGLALSAPLAANQLLFTTSEAQPATGQRIDQRAGLTQIALTGGGTVSIVDAAEYRLNEDGSIDLYEGAITVTSGPSGEVVVRMPEGLEGRVAGVGSASNFTVRGTGEASGHALTGALQIGRAGALERFGAGEMWRARGQGGVRRVIANNAIAQPAALAAAGPAQAGRVVPIGSDAGPVAAALNGIPTGFGDQLATAGASSDIIAAARRIEAVAGNPALDTFPSGDLALLVSAAAQIEDSYGGTPFPQAQADIIRAYLRFLAGGGAGSEFLGAYSGFVASYLDLIRAGGLPSGFASSGPDNIDAYLSYIRRTGAFSDLAARDRVLADAYLAFLASGGNRDGFALSFTDLTSAYFAFVRGGGDPTAFTGASQAALAQTIAFLRESGLVAQLGATDRALAEAFLANGGLAFAAQYETALGDYFAFLASGRRPSAYTAIDQATLRAYLETLANTGLLQTVLGEKAGFYADYLAFLRAGGEVDGFTGLPANVFAGYAAQLDAYFAFLSTGRRPSEFSGTDIAVLQAWVLQLQQAGALDRFLGDRAAFFSAFASFVAGGGSIDGFTGLPANVFAGYAVDLRTFFDFLNAGGVPSGYTLLTLDQVRAYIAALEAAGATSRFLGDSASFYRDYAVYLASGANPDLFAGLPVAPDFPAFAAALNAYALFLQGGGLPTDYTAQDLAQLQGFIDALTRSGQFAALVGDNADLLTRYFAFLSAGGTPDGFAGLPVYSQYVAALNAYFAFLSGGGLPSDYTVLDQATLNAYLDALAGAQGGLAGFGDLNGFFAAYAAFVSGGGNPANFAGLPVYADYVAALNAYFAFLADGGLPSEYTALDLSILEAYLAALAALQGGLGGFADLNAFFVEYFAFLQGGGNPDMFVGLPGSDGGGGPTDPGNNPTLVYSGGFDGPQPNIAYAGNGFDGQSVNARPLLARLNGFADAGIAANGALQSYGGLISETGAASVQEISGDRNLLIGRFTDGTFKNRARDLTLSANQGFHYLLARDITGALTLPSGVIEYDLLGATRPTLFSGAIAPGTFAANLAVEFSGPRARFGIDGTITMPGDSGFVYSFSTPGGSVNPNGNPSSLVIIDGGINFSASGSTNEATPRSGSIDFQGFLGDATANRLGVTYLASLSGSDNISGAAIFGRADTIGGGDTGGGDTGGGNTGGTPLILANQTPFTATTGINYNLRAPTTGLNGFSADGITSDSNGAITAILESFRPRSIGTATAVDVSTNARFAIGRWSNGIYVSADPSENTTLSATQGLHYLFAGPTTGGFAIPTTGRIDYDLIAATAPTIADGSLAPGQFQADMAVLFGATNRVAMEGSITMPKAGGDFVYGFSTQGGIANAQQSTSEFRVTQGRNVNFSILGDGITTSDNSCDANCTIQFAGYFAGADISQLGLTYNATGQSNLKNLNGAAIFGNGALTGPPVSAVTGNRLSATVTTDLFVSQGNLVSLDFSTANPGRTNSLDTVQNTPGSFGYKTDADGRVIEIGGRNGWFDRIAPVGTNFAAASNTDIGRTTSGAVRWSRWSNGGVVPSRFGPPPPFGINANGGYHIIIGTPSTNLPTGGRVDYTLVGGTRPTAVDGSVAPGILTSGSAAVQFGASPKVGISLGFDYNSNSYVAQTTGGVANLATSELSLVNGGFTGRSANGSVTGGACAGACSVEWTGFLAGVGGTEIGVQYDIRFAADIAVIGTAALRATTSGTQPSTNPYAGGAGGGAVSVAPSSGTIAGIDMNRWGGTGTASPQGGPASIGGQELSLLPPGLTAGEGTARGNALARQAAVKQAEQLMGGMITFDGGMAERR